MYPLDDEEKEILEAFESGNYVITKDEEEQMRIAKEAACNYTRKDKPISIRLSSSDLNLIKRQAAMEGLPYQTYLSSWIHKIATGQINKHDTD